MRGERSLSGKLTALLIGFAVVPLLLMACLLVLISWRDRVQEEMRRGETALDNIEADARMLASQTESVIRTFSDSDGLKAMLASGSDAEWAVNFNTYVNPELTRAELYLSSLDANILIIFDGDRFSLERWYMLLSARRFAGEEGYERFVASGQKAGWCGVGEALPPSIKDVYDYRGIGKKLIYYCSVSSLQGQAGAVIQCAVNPAGLIESARVRAEDSALYILAGDETAFASDGEAIPPEALTAAGGYLYRQGSFWQRREVSGMGLTVLLRTGLWDMVRSFLRANLALILLVFASVFLLFFVSMRVMAGILARLKRLAQAADGIDAKDGRAHLPDEGGDEVGRAARAFNRLFDRLEQQMNESMEKEKAKRHMQALALQYQLNPHFLFNSLTWLQMELEDQGVDPALSENITKLASVLRYNLSESLEATLAQEAEHLRAYVDFMSDMKQQRITLRLDWDEGLNGRTIPRFMLQPVVENALQHGLILGRDMEIDVAVAQRGDKLVFTIANDGRPVDGEGLSDIRDRLLHPEKRAGSGLGLSNLAQRLGLRFGENYSVEVSSGQGLTVFTLTIPA